MKYLIFIALGGAGGALARHWVSNWMHDLADSHFPLGTLTVNFIGSFLLGVMYAVIVERGLIHADWRSVFIVGFLGAFTTFSTFSLETVALLENGQGLLAATYVMSSVAVCVFSVWTALVLTRLIG